MRVQPIAIGGHFRPHEEQVMPVLAVPELFYAGQLRIRQGDKISPAAAVLAPAPGGKSMLAVLHHGRITGATHLAVIAAMLHIHEPVASPAPKSELLPVFCILIGQNAGYAQAWRQHTGRKTLRMVQFFQGTRHPRTKKRHDVEMLRQCRVISRGSPAIG